MTAPTAEVSPLARHGGEQPPAPDWFRRAVARQPESHFVPVVGVPIHYLRWGAREQPGPLLVHGNAAHAHWWSFIAPFFADDFNVAAIDLSGMGDSGWRAPAQSPGGYSAALYVQEMLAVCEDAGMLAVAPGPIVAAHSFGGLVATQMAAAHGDRLSGLVVIDTPIHPRTRPTTERRRRGTATYSSMTAALTRFQLMPPQPCPNDFLLDWVARHSLRPVTDAGGKPAYRWKFDPEIWRNFLIADTAALIHASACPTAIMYGAQSALMDAAAVALVHEKLGGKSDIVRIDDAHHHVMLDQPLVLAEALRNCFAAWAAPNNP